MASTASTANAAESQIMVDSPSNRETCERKHLENVRKTGGGRVAVVHIDRPDLWAASLNYLPDGFVIISCENGRARAELISEDLEAVKRRLGIE